MNDVIFNREDICDDAVHRLIVKELTESVELLSEAIETLSSKPTPFIVGEIDEAHYLRGLRLSINETIAYFSVPGEYHDGLYDIGGKKYGG